METFLVILLLGISLSMDAFSLAIIYGSYGINLRNEIMSSIFSENNTMRSEINYTKKKKNCQKNKKPNTWRLDNMLLNNQEINEEIKEENFF